MKNPNNNSIIYLTQNEKFFTLTTNYYFNKDMKILTDGDNDFVTPFRMMIDPKLMIRALEYIIELKYIHQNDFPKHININGIVNV